MVVEDPIPKLVWKACNALPVIPIEHKLRPWSVLVRKDRIFHLIGDLATLCLENERAYLENAMRDRTNYSVTDRGEIIYTMGEDSRWFSRLLAWQMGFNAGFNNVHQFGVHIPSHQSVSIEDREFRTVTAKFAPDRENPYFPMGKSRDVWVVNEIITAPSLSVYALHRTGANIGGAVLPIPPVPLNVDAALGGEVGNECVFRIIGPVTVDGEVQPLPFAFHGFKFKYENGCFKKPRRARYQSDGAGASPDEPIRDTHHATPSDGAGAPPDDEVRDRY